MSDAVAIRFTARTPQLKCDSGQVRMALGLGGQTATMAPSVARLLGLGQSQQVEVRASRAVLRIQAKSAQLNQAVQFAVPGAGGAAADNLPASEDLQAGAFVNVWDNAGVGSLRLADNRNPAKEADGFVLTAFAGGAVATFFRGGDNSALASLVPGSDCWLGQAGGVIQAPLDNTVPANAGKISQYLGKSLNASVLQFHRLHSVGIA